MVYSSQVVESQVTRTLSSQFIDTRDIGCYGRQVLRFGESGMHNMWEFDSHA